MVVIKDEVKKLMMKNFYICNYYICNYYLAGTKQEKIKATGEIKRGKRQRLRSWIKIE